MTAGGITFDCNLFPPESDGNANLFYDGEYMYQPLLLFDDNEANYEKILYGLDDRFDLYDLDGRDNWMRGEFDSKWCYPEEAIAAMMKTLEKDPTLHIEIVSCEPGMQYLEAHIYDNGMWNSF